MSGELCISSSSILPLVLAVLLAEHVTGQLTLLIIVIDYLMEAPWLPTVLNMLEDVPHQGATEKISLWIIWCARLSRACNCCTIPLAGQRFVVQIRVLFLSLLGSSWVTQGPKTKDDQ